MELPWGRAPEAKDIVYVLSYCDVYSRTFLLFYFSTQKTYFCHEVNTEETTVSTFYVTPGFAHMILYIGCDYIEICGDFVPPL